MQQKGVFMTLTVTRSDEHTIALPTGLIEALGLQEGDKIEAVAAQNALQFIQRKETAMLADANGGAVESTSSTLEELIAQIKALPPNPQSIHSPDKPVEQLLAELDANPPSEALFSYEEWQQLWQEFEAEQKAFEHENDVAEGLA
jgi:hypothetical protein